MKEVLSFKILKMPHLNYVFAQNTYHVNGELSLIVFEDFTPYWLTLDCVIKSPSTFINFTPFSFIPASWSIRGLIEKLI